MRVIVVTQARIGSSRLPGKVLKEIAGKTLLQIHLERLSQAHNIDKIIVATTMEPDVYKICDIARSLGIDFYQGSLNDVLDRYYNAVKELHPDLIVRVTSDCPLVDPIIIDEIVTFTLSKGLDYVSNSIIRTYPDGVDVEVFTFKSLEIAWKQAVLASEREHVTPYIWKNCDINGGQLFRGENFIHSKDLSAFRLTVDEPADLELIKTLVGPLGTGESWQVYVDYLISHPELVKINQGFQTNEGYLKSLERDVDFEAEQ
jgi:spore coat polysaccharide biosynthesis protein SpsF